MGPHGGPAGDGRRCAEPARRPVRRAGRPRRARAARGRRPGCPLPRGRPADGPRGPAGRDAGVRDRARDAGGDPRATRRSSPTSPGSGSARSWRSCSRRRDRRSGCGSPRRPGCSPSCRPSSRRSAASRRTRSRARTSGTTRCGSVDAAPADRPVTRLAALLHDIGKPATLADGHFHHHDVVGRTPGRRAPAPAALPAGGDRRGGPPRPPPHVHGGSRRDRRGRQAVHQADRRGADRRAVRAASRRRHRQRPVAGRPGPARVPRADRRGARGRGSARPVRARDRRHGPDARAWGSSPDRGWAGCSTRWSSW